MFTWYTDNNSQGYITFCSRNNTAYAFTLLPEQGADNYNLYIDIEDTIGVRRRFWETDLRANTSLSARRKASAILRDLGYQAKPGKKGR
jgi:hypothetical protein